MCLSVFLMDFTYGLILRLFWHCLVWIFVFILEDLSCVSPNENVNGLFQVHAMTFFFFFFCCARSHHCLKLPVQFKPTSAGRYARPFAHPVRSKWKSCYSADEWYVALTPPFKKKKKLAFTNFGSRDSVEFQFVSINTCVCLFLFW